MRDYLLETQSQMKIEREQEVKGKELEKMINKDEVEKIRNN